VIVAKFYDAFHLELRYNDLTSELDIRVTITGDTAAELAATVEAAIEQSSQSEQRAANHPDRTHHDPRADALRARGGGRTRTPCGSRF
jgi:hypothetical protein